MISTQVDAVKNNAEVIKFISNCGDDNLMFLLHPPRLKKALHFLDTDQSGEIDKEEWDEAISRGLAKRLEQLAAERERRERAAEKADAEFSNEFLNAARKCFEMIDDDQSGTLEKAEIVLPGVLLIINPAHSLIDLRTGNSCPVEPKSNQIPNQLRQ